MPERSSVEARIHPQQQQREIPYGLDVRFRRKGQLSTAVGRRARIVLLGGRNSRGQTGTTQYRTRRTYAQQVAQRSANGTRPEPSPASGYIEGIVEKDTRS